ncbi:MAG: oligopeptidase B, partial [Bdellovibrionales bacterium]
MFEPARKIPHRHEIHGDVRDDDYFWMRERDTKPVMDYLKQENHRTNEAMEPVAKLEGALYREMRARIKEDDSSVPVLYEGYYYYTRFATGQEYEIHCRKKGSLTGSEEVILDENQMSQGLKYFEVADVQVSPDQKLLAYAVDTVGRRIHDIYVKDLASGKQLADKIENVTANFVWAADNKTLFYVRQDPETLRSYQVFRYELGSGKSELVYEERDTTYNVGVGASKNHGLLYMAVDKRDSSEWRTLDAKNPRGEWKVFLPREDDHEYSLTDGGDGTVYILTNWKARNFRVMQAPLDTHDKNQWKEIIPVNPKIYLEGIDAYAKFMVISERENGLTQIRLRDRASGNDRLLKFPEPAYEVGPMGLPEYNSTTIRFNYQSMVQPPSVYDEEVDSQKRTLMKVREVPGYKPELYESKRLWAKAKDGTLVPMSILYKKGMKLDGSNPTLLYGYGSYGLTTDI